MGFFIEVIAGDYCIFNGGKIIFRFKHKDIANNVLSLLKLDSNLD